MGAERTEIGCAGHFICGYDCQWHRHTNVGGYRVSTVGEFRPNNGDRKTLGASADSFFETMVFPLSDEPADDSEGCGCREVAQWSELECDRYATAGAAQAGHETMVAKYAALAEEEATQ